MSLPAAARVKPVFRWLLTLLMVGAGVYHFVAPAAFVAIVPEVLPAKRLLVEISGVAEILGGLGLILPATRKLAAWGIIALLIAVFPANINMAVNQLPLGDRVLPAWQQWGRLPLQFVGIAWAYWFTRADRDASGAAGP